MEGHIYSSFATGANFQVPEISFPALSLLLSGGHTELVLMQDWHDYTIIGQTVDDALGEAFDKTARLMGLPYPGGPEIDKLASKYSEFLQTNKKEDLEHYTLPRPLLHSSNYNFSFSGLKTAVRYLIDTLEKPLKEETKQAISHEFQSSVLEVVAKKTKRAIEEFAIATLLLGGGVTANKHIQEMIVEICKESKTELYIPKGVLAMDNALMIAIVGSILFQRNQQVTKEAVLVNGGLTLG
jgi:N6-L-threonylcarbamoyladenine synthase